MSERSSAQLQKSNTPSNSLTTVLLPSSEAENNHSDLSLAISKTQAENKYFNRVEGAGSAPKAESSKVISKSFELPKTGNGIEEDGAEANTIHESQGVQSIIEQIQVRDMAMRLYEQARAATGIQHSAHLIFQSLNGQRYAADMEAASEERAKDARNGVNTIERTYLEDREIEKAKQEKSALGVQEKNTDIKKTVTSRTDEKEINIEKARQIEATFSVDQFGAIGQLEDTLLATHSLYQLANILHYITPENPSGDGGLLDVIV
jgi:hypothetical protein